MFDTFRTGWCATGGGGVHYRVAGQGPAILLIHGFPQTGAMWAEVAADLVSEYRVIVPDLRGYGASAKPPAEPLENYAFRAMAQDMADLLAHLDLSQAHVVGHDRGARVAHRMALDHEAAALSLTLMDIVPTHTLLRDLTREVAAAYYHWFFLAQPAPFPETMIGYDPDTYFESCLLGWGSATLEQFGAEQLAEYRAAWRAPDCIAGMCADYRAALSVDFAHDAEDADRSLTMPTLVLYGLDGVMARLCDVPGTWMPKLADMRAEAIAGGHFFIDSNPRDTIRALRGFVRKVT